MGLAPGDDGYLDLIRTANDAGRLLETLAAQARRIAAPTPSDLGIGPATWDTLQDAARAAMTWGTTVGEMLANGRPIRAGVG